MASKGSKNKETGKPRIDRTKKRQRAASLIFLGLSIILILSMVLSAVAQN